MTFQSKNGFSYSEERDDHIWTTKEMVIAIVVGFVYGFLLNCLLGI